MKLWYRINNILLLVGLLAVPAAFLYQGYVSRQIAAANEALGYEPMNCSYVGILIFFLMMDFLFLFFFLCWNYLLKNFLKNRWYIWLQLFIISVIGIIPGLFIAVWGFIAK